jgi:multidrug efflux pump subunit AcrA (membrane-fusion protein)
MRPGVEGEEVHPYVGVCYFIDNFIDETTSTFLSKARIPNPQGTLLPGEYVKLEMKVDDLKDVVVVPASAVMETESGPVVYVIDKEGKVAIQRVEAGLTMYKGLRVLTKGLDAGVPVIVEGLQLIRPGMVVKAEPAVIPQPVEKEAVALADAPKADAPKADAQPAATTAEPAPAPKSRVGASASTSAPDWPRSPERK